MHVAHPSCRSDALWPLCRAGTPSCAQVGLIEDGREADIVQETRLFDEAKGVTFTMRKKEGLADYRYFPEPDLPPLVLDASFVEGIQARTAGCSWQCVLSAGPQPRPS